MSLSTGRHREMSVHPTDGIVRSGRRMLAILVSMVRTRLDLLAIELMEEKSRIWLMVVLTALALMFAGMALIMVSLLVIVAFWDENRLLAIGGLLAFYVAACAISLLVVRHKAKLGSKLFTHTLRELAQDSEELRDGVEPDVDDDLDLEIQRRRARG